LDKLLKAKTPPQINCNAVTYNILTTIAEAVTNDTFEKGLDAFSIARVMNGPKGHMILNALKTLVYSGTEEASERLGKSRS
jgi:hypothetical protein